MDVDQAKLLWTPEIALRSKPQVLQEDWEAPDIEGALMKLHKRDPSPIFANTNMWTTLKPNASTLLPHDSTLFYQANSSPPIPTLEAINDALAKNDPHIRVGVHWVCRIGDAIIKCGARPNIVEVSKSCP